LKTGAPPTGACASPGIYWQDFGSRIFLGRFTVKMPQRAGLAFVALLPVAPLIAGFNHAESVVRWTCCAMLSAIFTAVLLLCMPLSIALA
jgi:hypothetical protein